jgi:(S)-2-hydroxyglutarate dehydrogenase
VTEARELAVVGGGIVGVATALALVRQRRRPVVVLEAEDRLAAHQTGHNSGVIHAGLYYKPGSLKATLCAEGREELIRFCEARGVRYERCGKLVVATRPEQLPKLDELERRGRANGLTSLRRLSAAEVREREPEAAAVAGLLVEETGIVDFTGVTRAMAAELAELGGEVRTGHRVRGVVRNGKGFVLQTSRGELRCGTLVNCAGLHSDRVARMCGLRSDVQIVPFRGEYYQIRPERAGLVRHLIYPVPDPALPFLGVHFTRRVDGMVEAGPNAVLAWARHGYRHSVVSPRDLLQMAAHPGFWRMARRHWRTGWEEFRRSLSLEAFTRSLQELVPALRRDDLAPGGAGVRAQAVAGDGRLVDDFLILEGEGMVHVLNAPSPAATSSLAIGRYIAARVEAVAG